MTEKWIRDTGLVAVLVLTIFNRSGNDVLFVATIFVIFALLLHPKLLYPLAYVWHKLVLVLGMIMPKVFFSAVFFLVITPIGFLKKILKGDSLMVASWKKESTMFRERNYLYNRVDLEKPY